ncbi:hypothetical protein [Sphingorhabdus sp. M41]|uniref:hypothetical protein n=1 Tax=Sphingorhabdus sp. M41 TaxID=1806885 RepID=UPI0018D3E85A|nr:hypothetical protein [Sphingorhabdus sp. M41]
MLSIAISSFFLLAFAGSAIVISMMFFQYRDRIASVIRNGVRVDPSEAIFQSTPYRHRTVKTSPLMAQHRSPQRVPLRAAA